MDAVAESNACQEAQYYLRKLLDRERITLEDYLKVCRIATMDLIDVFDDESFRVSGGSQDRAAAVCSQNDDVSPLRHARTCRVNMLLLRFPFPFFCVQTNYD